MTKDIDLAGSMTVREVLAKGKTYEIMVEPNATVKAQIVADSSLRM